VFEQFTDRARRVIVLAQEESRLLNHNYIGTEHILLGLIHEGEGVASIALESLGISLEEVRVKVEEIIGHGQTPPTGKIPFTPRAKKVLELSLREALQLGHNYIGTEHILLGLVREGEGVAAEVLIKLGGDLGALREEVIKLLAGMPPVEATAPRRGAVGFLRRRDIERSFEGPACPQCRAKLASTMACRVMDAPEDDSDAKRSALVVYCRDCGATLGVLPAF
jgi:ATP-dependent Clp protease ATP-binding subunit ClpC